MTKLAERLAQIRAKGPQYRSADVVKIDVEARTVELSFSSESAEVETWWGVEVLGHNDGEIRMARINDGGALLMDHNWRDQIGVVENAWIDPSDKRGRAVVRFGKSARAEEIFQDVIDEIRTKISVGYNVHAIKLVEERGDTDVYRVTDWEPLEISFVSVPADTSVGVGRSAEIPREGDTPAPADTSATNAQSVATINNTEASRKMEENEQNVADARRAGGEAERNRSRSIIEMGREYGNADLAAEYVAEGKSPEEFQRALLKRMSEHANKPLDEQVQNAEIGLTEREAGNFSFLRAIRAQLPNASTKDRDAAGFEFECSRAAEKAYGKTAQGILIPADVLNQRTFSTTTPAGGSGAALIATDHKSGSFIEMLRNRTWLLRRATLMAGLVGKVEIPRQKGGNQSYWVGEGNEPTKGEPAMDQVPFDPKSLAALTEITRRLMQQATPDAENIVRNDLIKAMALGIDKAGIYGTGTAFQPKGVANMSGINAVPFAGVFPTYAELVEMETAIALDNADVGAMSYAFNASMRGNFKTAQKFPGTPTGATVWEQGNTVNGYATDVSNQMEAGDVVFGNWADLIIAMWGGLDLTVDPYSLSASGGTRIVTFQDIDTNVRHLESFCLGRKA
ncbi:phage major capsid protein [Dyella sp. 2RAF44]|uniref:phage major capsid protein n=1 Tax=Dyella sp. 2RAF44 TaxID=3233000 RepID=UPI003F93AA93